ncbi:MAG: BadF/BadG/BcrA/BcrD ATPase family protein [Verrucomicrobiota bacterium]
MKPNRIFIGIDGGGTHSYGVAVDAAGRVLATAQSGSLNFHGGGLTRARQSLRDLIQTLDRQLPSGSHVDNFAIGSAALFIDSSETEKKQFCGDILPLTRTRLVGDCLTAYHGACLGEPGVLVISGTGSIILVRNEAGVFLQGGGWGHILGDAGSAWWIALESTKAAIADVEGLGPKTMLATHICQFYGVKKLCQIIPIVYDAEYSKDKFAALGGFLAEHASEDEVFQEICRRGGSELAAQALAAVKRANLQLNPLPLYLAGGVLEKNIFVRASLVAEMSSKQSVKIIPPLLPALLGATVFALQDGGVAITPKLLETLRASHNELAAKNTFTKS